MRLSCIINLNNAAYQHEDGELDRGALSESIYAMVGRIQRGEDSGVLFDVNGNTVGTWKIWP